MTSGFSRNSTYDRDSQTVAVQAVNTETGICTCLTRYGTSLEVDSSYYTGAVNITPATGEQWVVERTNGRWKFLSRVPFLDPTQSLPMQEGQTVVGSTGPTIIPSPLVSISKVMKIGDPLYRSNNGQMEYSPDVDPPLWTVVSTGPAVDADGFYILAGVEIDVDGMYDPKDLLIGTTFDF